MPALPDSKGLLTGISEETSQDFDKDETSQDLESQSTTESTSQVTILLLMVDHIVDDMLVSSLLGATTVTGNTWTSTLSFAFL